MSDYTKYMSTTQAGKKWGIGRRMVSVFCAEGRIPGAELIGKSWTIPADAEKPSDARFKNGKHAKKGSHIYHKPPDNATPLELAGVFQTLIKSHHLTFQFLDLFPYAIEVFSPDGTSVFLNRSGCEDANIADASQVVGHYNILKDTVVLDILGQRETIERAFKGERITAYDVRVPREDTTERYDPKDESTGTVLYQNISCFPLWDDHQQIAYIVMVFITTQIYTGRTDIIKAQEYMDQNWAENFDRDRIAKAVHISPNHFSSLFKEHTGYTPKDYYKQVKVRKIQEKLLDPNLNIEQAFAACGADYHGSYRQYFKDITGQTPMQYREKSVIDNRLPRKLSPSD